jgi:hypothetical protein
MEKPTLHYYGNLIIVEDGEGDFSDRDDNTIERDNKQRAIIQMQHNHTFSDGGVGLCYRVHIFYSENIEEGEAKRKVTAPSFGVLNMKPSQVIRAVAKRLGSIVASEFLELQDKDQQSMSLYAAQAWGKSGLGEIDFMLAFWERISSKNAEL